MITRRIDWRKRGHGVLNGHLEVERLPSGRWKVTSLDVSAEADEYQDAVGEVQQKLMEVNLDNRVDMTDKPAD